MQGLDLNLFFFFAKNFNHLTISNKCRDFGRCFGLNLFENFFENYDFLYFRSLVGNTVAVGGPTNKSGCLLTSDVQCLTGKAFSESCVKWKIAGIIALKVCQATRIPVRKIVPCINQLVSCSIPSYSYVLI